LETDNSEDWNLTTVGPGRCDECHEMIAAGELVLVTDPDGHETIYCSFDCYTDWFRREVAKGSNQREKNRAFARGSRA
jgi:hypothetical protein